MLTTTAFSPGDVVTIPSTFVRVRTLPLTVVESDHRHTLVRFDSGAEQWYDTARLALVAA